MFPLTACQFLIFLLLPTWRTCSCSVLSCYNIHIAWSLTYWQWSAFVVFILYWVSLVMSAFWCIYWNLRLIKLLKEQTARPFKTHIMVYWACEKETTGVWLYLERQIQMSYLCFNWLLIRGIWYFHLVLETWIFYCQLEKNCNLRESYLSS